MEEESKEEEEREERARNKGSVEKVEERGRLSLLLFVSLPGQVNTRRAGEEMEGKGVRRGRLEEDGKQTEKR